MTALIPRLAHGGQLMVVGASHEPIEIKPVVGILRIASRASLAVGPSPKEGGKVCLVVPMSRPPVPSCRHG
jgi:hypothetical protein